MKSVVINALVGLLAATGSVDARALRRACKARSLTLSASSAITSPTAVISASGTSGRSFTVTPLSSSIVASATSTAVSVTPTISATSAAATSAKATSSSSAAVSSSLVAISSTASSAVASSTSSASTPKSTSEGLDALWKANNRIFIGAPTDKSLMVKDSRIATTLKSDFGSVTPENSMKWDAIEPTQGQFSFDTADYLVDFASTNSMSVRGHTLVWHEQLPSWVSAITDKATMKSVLENHVKTIVSHYKGKVRSWDVVNEVFNDDGSMRETVFYNVLGEDFISIAFNAAHEADPSAKLYINEYSLDAPDRPKLVNGMVPKVKEWLAAGIPIHGIGSESHLDGGNVGGVPDAIKALAATGIEEITLTETDISTAPSDDYVTVFKACLDVPACVGITIWGVSDATAWRPGAVLFDDSYQPKPALAAVKAALAA